MPAVVDSVAEMGIGDYDGQLKIIEYATEKQSMRWHPDVLEGVWLSEPRPTIRYKFDFPTAANANPVWQYMTNPTGEPGVIGRSGFGWTPQAIHRADAAYAAGLILWEKIDYLYWTWDDPNEMYLATVFFDLDPDDVMSTVISSTADSHKGTVIQADVGARKMHTTGWVKSQIPIPEKGILAPHYYTKGSSAAGPTTLEFITAQWRWMGDPTPGDMIDVPSLLTGLDDGEILVWDSTDSRFEPGAL